MESEDKIARRLLLFILISLALHVILGVFFYEFHSPREARRPELEAPQEVVFIKPEDILPQPAVVSAAQLELADIAKPKVEKAPPKARFKSQYNSSVPKETVAVRPPKKARMDAETSEEEGTRGDRADLPGPRSEKKPTQVATKPAEAKPEAPPEEKPEAKPEEKEISLSDLSLKPTDFKDLLKEKKSSARPEKTEKSLEGKDLASIPNLGKRGLPGTGDHFVHDFMPHVKIGDKTYLNALAFPDVQYFARLKRVFRMRFDPSPPLRHHFAGNRVVVGKVTVTMAMSVNPGGQLKDLFVVKSSGIPSYDQEALRTIRESSPFSAPPQKVCDKDGMLRMTWNFITYL